MIKKIYSLSFSIVCAGFLWSSSAVHAMPGCETFCQPKICSASPDLATVCFKDCPQAQACHMAVFEEFRRLHEIHNRSNQEQKPYKDRDGIKRERGEKSIESQSDVSSLTSELLPVPLSSEPLLPTNDESPVLTQTPELSLIPSPPPPPSDLTTGKSSVNVGEGAQDLLTQLNNKRGELKKPAEITASKSTVQEGNNATKENDIMQSIAKAMKDRREHIDPDDTDTSKDNSDDWGDD